MGMTLDQITALAGSLGGGTVVAVAGAHDAEVLKAALGAAGEGLCSPLLVGFPARIRALADELGLSCPEGWIVPAEDDALCARKAVELVRLGRAGMLMKGCIDTSTLMRAVIDKETGIRTGALLSHVMLYQMERYPKVLAVTDGGMVPAPSLEQKVQILENAARLFRALGYGAINAACVCGSEIPNPKIPAMRDALALSAMGDRWAAWGMSVIGPVGLDLAVSPRSCAVKRYHAPGAGDADILLVPTYETGNAFGKGLTCFAGARHAGIVLGARRPIVLVSRADDAEAKRDSIALGAVAAARGL